MATKTKRRSFGKHLTGLFSVADLFVVNILFAITLLLCPELMHEHRLKIIWVLVNVAYFPSWLYLRNKSHMQRVIVMDHVVKNAFMVVGLHALFFFALLAFLDIYEIPAQAFMEFYGLMIIGIPLWWLVSRQIIKALRRHGYNYVRVAIVGTGPIAMRLVDEIRSDAGFGYKVLGFFSNDTTSTPKGKVLGTIDDMPELVKELEIDQIFYTYSGADEQNLSKVVKVADDNVIPFFYVPQVSRFMSRSFQLHNIGQVPLMSFRKNPLNSLTNRIIKRTFDIAFSSVVLLFSPIIFLPVAIAIKVTSPGPIFFKQDRTGYKGRTFKCWKFRTMKVNKNANTRQATRNDDRTTKIGKFLRSSSIDELPQFINVWLGDMSIVGPRPHMLKHTVDYTKLIDTYMVRHQIKPGITGWAQVNGYRGITDELWKMEKRVEYDVWYIENWSFLLDLKIIVRTVINALSKEENAF